MGVATNRLGQRAPAAQPKVEFIPVNGFAKGRFSVRGIDEIPVSGLKVTENVQLNATGAVTPMPGFKLYGTQPTGTVIGQVFEFTDMDTSVTPNTPRSWNIWMENRSGVGTVVYNKDGGTHTAATGKTYTITNAKPHFEQVFGKVLIMNGVDNLSTFDVQTKLITPMTNLTTPTIASVTPTSPLTTSPAGYLALRYRVTAANQGETAASTAVVGTVNLPREQWDGTTKYTSIVFNRVTGASRYNVYVGTQVGNEFYLDTIEDPGTGTTVTYVDTGTIAETATRTAPAGDSTAGPKTTRGANIKGQIYMVGDSDNPGRIWFGGTGNNVIDFSSYNGGGWVEPNKGGKDLPVRVIAFRDGKGTPMAACLSKGTNGAGKRYLLQPSSTTLGDTSITYMAVTEDNGAEGTDSPDAVAFIDDALIYPSRTGFKSSTTKPSIQNLISTSGISDNISDNVLNLNPAALDKAVQVTNDRRIYFALPFASTSNNQIWVLDLRNGGAWMSPMYVNADWLWLYNDNTLGTKVLALIGNQFMEMDANTHTSINGVAFPTNVATGGLKLSDDGSIWMSVIDCTFVFEKPQGNINLAIDAYTEDSYATGVPSHFADTMTNNNSQAVSAWGRYGWSAAGWGAMSPLALPVAITTSTTRRQWTIPVDEEVNMLTGSLNTTDAGVYYEWSKLIVRYVNVGFKEIDNV